MQEHVILDQDELRIVCYELLFKIDWNQIFWRAVPVCYREEKIALYGAGECGNSLSFLWHIMEKHVNRNLRAVPILFF